MMRFVGNVMRIVAESNKPVTVRAWEYVDIGMPRSLVEKKFPEKKDCVLLVLAAQFFPANSVSDGDYRTSWAYSMDSDERVVFIITNDPRVRIYGVGVGDSAESIKSTHFIYINSVFYDMSIGILMHVKSDVFALMSSQSEEASVLEILRRGESIPGGGARKYYAKYP